MNFNSVIIDPNNKYRSIHHIIDYDKIIESENKESTAENIVLVNGKSITMLPSINGENVQANSLYNNIRTMKEDYKGQLECIDLTYNGLGVLREFGEEFVFAKQRTPGIYQNRFCGEFRKGMKNGLGVTNRDGGDNLYEGEWENNCENGLGKKKFKSSAIQTNKNTIFSIYEGQFKQSKAHGLGIYRYRDSENKFYSFLGEFNDNTKGSDRLTSNEEPNKLNGIGLMNYYKEGSSDILDHSYEGEWNMGEWHGVGTLKDYSRRYGGVCIYEGQFLRGKYDRKKSKFFKNKID